MAEFVFRDPMCVILLEEHIASILNLHLFSCSACGFNCFSPYMAMKHMEEVHPKEKLKDLIHFKNNLVTDETVWDAFYRLFCSKIYQQISAGSTVLLNSPPISPLTQGILAEVTARKEILRQEDNNIEVTPFSKIEQPLSDTDVTVVSSGTVEKEPKIFKPEISVSDDSIMEIPLEEVLPVVVVPSEDVKPTIAELQRKHVIANLAKEMSKVSEKENIQPKENSKKVLQVDCNNTNQQKAKVSESSGNLNKNKLLDSLWIKVDTANKSSTGETGAKLKDVAAVANDDEAKPELKMEIGLVGEKLNIDEGSCVDKSKKCDITGSNRRSFWKEREARQATQSNGSTAANKEEFSDTQAKHMKPIGRLTKMKQLPEPKATKKLCGS